MPEAEFWQLIDTLDGSTDDAAVERLTEALRVLGKRKAVAFQERLASVLFDLDRETLCRQPVRWSDDPDDQDPIPLSDDAFLHLRADIVGKGKHMVDTVLAEPTVLLTTGWDDGEALLYAAEAAADDEIDTKFSYETGSNDQHWTALRFALTTYQRPIAALLLSDLLDPIELYEDEASTIPVKLPMYAWPTWFPSAVLRAASNWIDAVVREGGGVPAGWSAEQIRVYVGLGERWRLTPQVEWKADDDTGFGEVVELRVEMRQSDIRSWGRPQQQAALKAVGATCVLAVLPPNHPDRSRLAQAVAAGEALLPTGPQPQQHDV